MAAEAFPLQWPEGWPRTPPHRRGGSRFGKNMGFNQIGKLQNELRLMGARNVVMIAMRVEAGANSALGHRISNLIEQIENLRDAEGEQRENLIKLIDKSMADIKALTPERKGPAH